MINKGYNLVKFSILLFIVGYTFYVIFTVPEDEDMPGVYRFMTLTFGFVTLYAAAGTIKVIDLIIMQLIKSISLKNEVKKWKIIWE